MTSQKRPPQRETILESLRDYLEQLVEEGLEGAPYKTATTSFADTRSPLRASEDSAAKPSSLGPADVEAPKPRSIQEQAATKATAAEPGELFSPYPGLEAVTTLTELREFIGDCRRCKLWRSRTNLVFGVGNPSARVMFVGEGPGAEEDEQGEPFVGRAGQLLTDIIERGMGLKRSEVYIANVIKCRPPENRTPEPDEVAACLPFLMRQVEIVRPEVIVALGSVAAQALLKVKTPISRLRGQWYEVRGIPTMPTFHPAYLLRNPADKRHVWSDIQKVMEKLGLPIPKRGRIR